MTLTPELLMRARAEAAAAPPMSAEVAAMIRRILLEPRPAPAPVPAAEKAAA